MARAMIAHAPMYAAPTRTDIFTGISNAPIQTLKTQDLEKAKGHTLAAPGTQDYDSISAERYTLRADVLAVRRTATSDTLSTHG
jgi:hypothetical protein